MDARSKSSEAGRPGRRRSPQRGPARGLAAFAMLLLCGSVTAQAEGPGDPDADRLGLPAPRPGSGGDGRGAPGLDALLKLPSGYLEPSAETVGGAGEGEWRRRFAQALEELGEARAALSTTKQELDSVADGGGSSQWAVAPPGVSNSGDGPANSPLSFKLRQELDRNRERLDAAEKALRELRIEADLAGVPRAWRGDGDAPIPRRLPDDRLYP